MNSSSGEELARKESVGFISAGGAPVFRRGTDAPTGQIVRLSIVIPVYNGSQTIGQVVQDVVNVFGGLDYEILLVNDGSGDTSEQVCQDLVDRSSGSVVLLQLSRNFGEHNAVLAGLKHAAGDYVAILDDDGQNGATDARRMLEHAIQHDLDVVYGRYRDRQHPLPRILGSWFTNRVATVLLHKPADLYLSSFKVMSRLVVDEISRHAGPMPYIDGLVFRTTRKVGQIDVQHHKRLAGRSGYTVPKLISLWMNMCVGFSLVPVRLITMLGLAGVIVGIASLFMIAVGRFWLWPDGAFSSYLLAAGLMMAGGIQLVAMGLLGEYVARIFLHQGGSPQHILRYVCTAGEANCGHARQPSRLSSLRFTAG